MRRSRVHRCRRSFHDNSNWDKGFLSAHEYPRVMNADWESLGNWKECDFDIPHLDFWSHDPFHVLSKAIELTIFPELAHNRLCAGRNLVSSICHPSPKSSAQQQCERQYQDFRKSAFQLCCMSRYAGGYSPSGGVLLAEVSPEDDGYQLW
jgi:hypothetical protein